MFKFTGFTEKANKSLNAAVKAAEDLGHTYIGSEHILLGLLSDTSTVAGAVLAAHNITYADIEEELKRSIGVGVPTELQPDDFTPRSKNILETSVAFARQMGQQLVGTEHVLLAIAREGSCSATLLLSRAGVSMQDIVNDVSKALMGGTANAGTDNKDGGKENESMLSQFGRDLTKLANDGKIDPVIGRQKEIERVIQILSRRTKNNPCLIGEPGVGKTAIAEGLALKIVSGEVPELLKDKKIYSLDLTGMVAGTKYRGDFEERIKKVIDEVKNAKDVILFIDEVHTLIGAGSAEGAADAANILKPSLARGELQIIGATTIEEYRKHIEKDAALERRFQPVMVDEPSQEEAIEILKGIKDKYEAHHKVKITDEAIAELFTKLDEIQDGDTLVLAGSIPSSLPADIYERILERLSGKKIRAVVDATKDLLLNVLKYRPFLIKPNNFELGEIFGTEMKSTEDIVKYAGKLKEMGARNVLVSMAGDGAVLLDENGQTHVCGVCRGRVKNSVGAGDSMVAGFIAGCEKGDYEYALKLGTASGGATAFSEGLAEKEKIFELLDQLG